MSNPRPLSRRNLLTGAGAAGLTGLLAACGGGGSDATSEPSATTSTPTPGEDATAAALEAVGVDAPVDLTVLVATFQPLTGPGRRIQFGLLDGSGSPALDRDVEAYLVRASDNTKVLGPVTPTFYGEGLGPRGVYVIDTDVAEAGIHDLVVVLADGSAAGTGALQVVTPEQSAVVDNGEALPVVDTPTVEDPKDLAELCTREPDCGMHDVSLETAIAEGRPVVLTIATPKFCTSAICGPVVDVVMGVKEAVGRDDVVFVHAEVFTDAGNTPTQIVTAYELPTEPWTFVVGADGKVVDRFDGPVVPALLRDAVESL